MKHHQPKEFIAQVRAGSPSVIPHRGAEGIAAHLWHQAIRAFNLNAPRYEQLLNEFVMRSRSATMDYSISRHFTVGNLRREFEKPSMTIKVLIKALKLLRIREATFHLELKDGIRDPVWVQRTIKLEDFFNGTLPPPPLVVSTADGDVAVEVQTARELSSEGQEACAQAVRERARKLSERSHQELNRLTEQLVWDIQNKGSSVHRGPQEGQADDLLAQ